MYPDKNNTLTRSFLITVPMLYSKISTIWNYATCNMQKDYHLPQDVVKINILLLGLLYQNTHEVYGKEPGECEEDELEDILVKTKKIT